MWQNTEPTDDSVNGDKRALQIIESVCLFYVSVRFSAFVDKIFH